MSKTIKLRNAKIEYCPAEFLEEENMIYIITEDNLTISLSIPPGHSIEDLSLQYSIGNGWNALNFEDAF